MKNTKNKRWTSKTIYDRILALCGQYGWSITRLAELAEMPASTIYSCRYRDSMPKIETLIAICDALDITLAKFFMVEDGDTDALYGVLRELSDSSKKLLVEVAKRMKT